jgi:hypothetical protein
MRTVALGPARDLPSWSWIGLDTGRELSKRYQVSFFSEFERARADVVIVVKERPPLPFMEAAHAEGSKVVYLPIDRYEALHEIEVDAELLGSCDLVLSHAESLIPILRRFAPRVGFVEHHARYALPELAPYREEGYVLWVGACANSVPLLAWLRSCPPGLDVKLLTDTGSQRARIAAHLRANEVGLRLAFTEQSINGIEARAWSEARQREMMGECRAAIDVKGGDFHQVHKSPTKAQQYVASGIPFACNPGSNVTRYFEARGFSVARPEDRERWFSREYWEETRRFGRFLRTTLSIEAVGATYRDHLDGI